MDTKVRLDKYLWAIRIFKTRSLATAAIDDGKVKWNGNSVKPSRNVALGDRYDIRTPTRKWTIEVVGIIGNRVPYEEAITKYVDQTSDEDKIIIKPLTSGFYTGKRISKTGRPTKKQRRDLGEYLGDAPEGD
ncbi:RNA-binding protein [Flavipsychrobacter stenotrophus]|uniref:RNA-binding protein n=1 Tax=Flavipsychrobacter stenotrophus TaxID=2077091 RepID=A0A2S7SXG1_9BACT|nr:RNA-binding S4 domain-containing protein [Flavipsychrobacter stenotrophus]PQJ11613.1 RNA-binding protein [Flavipsychrobacter stenotrophus]